MNRMLIIVTLLLLFSSCGVVWVFTGFSSGTGSLSRYDICECSETTMYLLIQSLKESSISYAIPNSFNKNYLIHGYLDTNSAEAKAFNSDTTNFHLHVDFDGNSLVFWSRSSTPSNQTNNGVVRLSLVGVSINGGPFLTEDKFDSRSEKKAVKRYIQVFENQILDKIYLMNDNCNTCPTD